MHYYNAEGTIERFNVSLEQIPNIYLSCLNRDL